MVDAQSEVALIVEKLGFGWAQISQLLVGGGIWASDAAELLIIGSITRSLSKEWHISAHERGSAASIIFVGMCIGNLMSGPIGDRSGRRPLVISSYFGLVVFSCLSAAAFNFPGMIICRVLVGISIGIGQPSWNALCNEISPKAWHADMMMLSQILFVVGECYAIVLLFLDDPNMKDLDWRRLLLEAAVLPVIILVVAYFLVKESPRFLAANGDMEGAAKVLQWMCKANNKPEVDTNLPPVAQSTGVTSRTQSESFFTPLKTIFRLMLSTTVLFGFSAFVSNVVFYGGLYAFPQVLPTLKMYFSPAAVLFIGIITEVLGYIGGARMVNGLSRRAGMSLYIFFMILGHLPYAILIDGSSAGLLPETWGGRASRLTEVLLVSGLVTCKVSCAASFTMIYTLVAQAYPTNLRTTGSAVCLGCGRLGAIVAPMIYELLQHHFGHAQAFFIFISTICFINLFLVVSIDPAVKDAGEVSRLRTTHLPNF